MRIGICLNMLTNRPGDCGIDWIERAADVGFDYVELPLAEISALPEDAFDALVERVEKSGLRCETMNNLFPKTLRLTGCEANPSAITAYLRHALPRAERLGAEYIVFGSGPAKTAPEGFPLDAAYRQVIEVARAAADESAARGIGIVIEPLRREECNLINTYQEGCALARDAQRPNVHALVDYYHLSEMEEPAAQIVKEGNILRHVHFARQQGRAYPRAMEEAEDLCARFAEALRTVGYRKRVSLEAYSSCFEKEAPAALRMMRQLFDEQD